MADTSGVFQASSDVGPGFDAEEEEKDKEKRLHALMEKLKMKAGQLRSSAESAKILRMAITDKRHQLEILEKSLLHRHLETLQKAFRVHNMSLMVDRLELCAKEVGLKFTAGHPEGTIFIGSDMFYVEVQLDAATVKVKDVKVMQGTDNVPSPEITKSLRDDNTDLFVEHLRGLSAVYPINGDKKLRSKCFLAMQSLETDLNLLAKLQSSISSVSNYIHKSPLGVLEPRVAGLPMKITYFVGPYDLLDTRTRTSVPMTIESIRERKLGHSVTVGIESSSPHKLPTMPLMTISKTTDGKSLPSFAAINSVNSSSLPAVFVLRLQRPLPMALSIIKKIQATTGIDFLDLNTVQPLLSLLIQSASRKAKHTHYDTSQGLSVTLPDQQHMYYFSTVNGSADLHGSMVSSIPFVHPTSVPKIIMFLRQQVLFNTLIGSCIRPAVSRPDPSTHDADCVMTFEVCPVSLHHVTVLFEHPLKDTMTTGEFDLCDVTAVKCKICTAANEEAICNDDYTTQVLQRCLSLPVTLRAIMQKARSRLGTEVVPPSPEPYNMMTLTPPLPTAAPMVADRAAASLLLSKVGQERRQAFISTHMYHDRRMGSLHPELMSGGTVQQNMHHMHPAPPTAVTEAGGVGGGITNNGAFESNFIDTNDMMEAMKAEKISKNPMLARLLDQDEVPSMANNAKVAVSQKQHSMLSALLDDDSTSSLTPVRHRKSRKRKSLAESRSPINSSPSKHYRSGDEDGSSGPCQDVGCCINSNTSPLAGLLASTPPGGGGETYTHESHVSKLASTLENIIKHESRHLSKCQHSELASILNEPDDYKKPSPRSQAPSLSNDLDRSNQSVHYGAGDCHRDSAAVDLPSANSAFQRTNSNEHVKMNSNTWPSPSDFDSAGRGTRAGRNSSFDRQLKGGETKDVDGRIKGGGALMCDGSKTGSSIDLTRKTNRSIRGSVESERGSQDSDVFMKEQIVTPTDFIADPKLAATPKSARSHSAESDPFDFNASLLNPDSNLVGAESDNAELDLDACDRQAFGCTPAVAPPKVTRSGSKNKNISTESAHDGKERKKERRDGKDALSTWSNSAKSKQLFNLKVNTKDLTTEMIVKELPHHCITSPDLVDEPKTQKSKDSKKTLNADKSSDALTDDSDVFQAPSGGSNFSGSGHRLMSNGSKQQSEQGTTASRSSKGQKRKQRLSKHGDGEKKRRRAEESKKDHLSKKQRIYDFDAEVNDNDGYTTPHVLKPTKIKITTAGGRMQVQPSVAVTPPAATSSKTPPLASTKYSSASSGSTIKLVKSVHGGGDRVSPKLSHSGTSGGGSGRPNSRVKSESGGGAGRERVDSKLQRTPTIKLKPINMPHNASAATTTSTKSSHSPATPSSGKSSTTPVVIASTQSSSTGHAKKPSQVKTRKNSLSAVIDKLTKQHSGGTGGALGLGGVVSEKDSEMPTKEKADAIRLKILSEGNKPSTPLKESFRSSQGGVKGSKLTFETKLNQKSLEHRRTSDLSRQQHVQSQPSSSGGSTAHSQTKPNLTKQGGAPVAPSGGHKGSSVSGDVVSSSRAESGKSTSVVNNVAAVNRSVSLPKGAVSVSSSGLKPTTPASSGLKSSTPPSASLVSRTMSVPLAAGQRGTSQGQKSPGAQSGTKTLSSVSKQSSASSVVNTPKAPSAAVAGCTKPASTATGKYLPQVATPKPVNCTAAIKNTTVSGSKTPSPVVQGATKTVPRPPTPDTSKTQSASVNGATATATASTSAKTVVPSKPSGDPRENQAARPGGSHDGDRQRKPKVDSAAADADQPKRHFLDVVSKIGSSPGDAATESRPAASNGGAGAGAGATDGSGWTASGAKPTPAHSHGRSHSIHCTDTTTRSNSVTNTKSFRTDGATVATPSGRNTPTSRGAGAVNNVAESDGGVLDLSAVARTTDTPAAATETKPTTVTPTARKCENAATPSRDAGPAASAADNSHSENKENTKFESTSYDGVFKAPTPKSAKSDERSRDAAPTRARAVASPHSDVSSPEDGLVIDCPGYSARSPVSKQHTTNSTRSPQSPAVVQPCSPAAVTDAVAWSPGAKSAQSPASRKAAKLSPVKSPMSQRNLVGSPPSNSPCEIDDDLMDAALML